MTDRFQELLWKRHDGELSAREGRWLEERLAADPRAREEAERTARLSTMLEDLPEEEPPVELRARIEQAVAGSPVRRASAEKGPGFLASVFGVPGGGLRLAYLTAGLVLGAIGYHAVHTLSGPWAPQDVEEVYGTMVRPGERVASGLTLSLAEEAGSLALWRADGSVLVELSLADVHTAELRLAGSGEVRLVALRHERPTALDVRHRENGLEIAGVTGGRLVLLAAPAEPAEPLEINVTSGGANLGHRAFELTELPASPPEATNFFLRWE